MLKEVTLMIMAFLPASGFVSGQQEEAAREILDEFARGARSSYPLSMEFEYSYESKSDEITRTEKGTIVIDNDKFRLILPGMQIYCNGETFWNYLPEQNEVYISDPEDVADQEDFMLSNPSRIFDFYQDNFKYRIKGETSLAGEMAIEIDLHPVDLSKAYHTIKLLIGKDNYRLFSIQTLEKQGVSHKITVLEYKRKVTQDDGSFVFDPSRYKEIEIIDTRL